MKLEKRFLCVHAVLVVGTLLMFLTGLVIHRLWLVDGAGILLGFTVQVLIIAITGLVLRAKALDQRPRAVIVFLGIIIAAVILGIFVFQLNRASACFHDYGLLSR